MKSPGADEMIRSHLQGKISRAQLLTAAASAGIATMALAGGASASTTPVAATSPAIETFPFFPQIASGTYTTESVDEIVSNILTWTYFEVSASTFILATPSIAALLGVNSGLPQSFLQAFNVEVQAQLDFWSTLVPNAATKTTTFTIDPSIVPNAAAALAIFEVAANVRIGLMIAAVREFAELGQPTLAKYAAQNLGPYAEERALARMFQALGGNTAAIPPNNKAFETDLFLYTRDAVGVLYGLGFINGKGVSVAYPGRVAALAASGATASSVVQLTPNNASSTVVITGPGSLTQPRS